MQVKKRQLVLFELPLPPFYNSYGKIQRDLAKKYKIPLIPKRFLGYVFATEGATSDGLHLTAKGHKLLAQIMIDLLDLEK